MVNTIFLFGYMGAGKTVIGKSLSKSIDYEFYDLDNFIELGKRKKFQKSLMIIMKSILETWRINT